MSVGPPPALHLLRGVAVRVVAIVVMRPDVAPVATGDRVGEAGDDPDVGPFHGRVGKEVDARAVDERVVPCSSEHEGAIGELRGERAGHVPERLEIGRMEVDGEPIGREGAIRG